MTLGLKCETASLHANNNKAYSVNDKDDVEKRSVETNGRLRLLSIPEQHNPQGAPNNESVP